MSTSASDCSIQLILWDIANAVRLGDGRAVGRVEVCQAADNDECRGPGCEVYMDASWCNPLYADYIWLENCIHWYWPRTSCKKYHTGEHFKSWSSSKMLRIFNLLTPPFSFSDLIWRIKLHWSNAAACVFHGIFFKYITSRNLLLLHAYSVCNDRWWEICLWYDTGKFGACRAHPITLAIRIRPDEGM